MYEGLKTYFKFLREGDPLLFHNLGNDSKPKTASIRFGVKALSKHKYFPSEASAPFIFGGHGQTALVEIKDMLKNGLNMQFDYDRRHLFTYSDGGQCLLDMKGKCFREDRSEYLADKANQDQRPILCLLAGLTSDSQTVYITNLTKEAYENRGFDVVAINYRGQGGCPLTTPRVYNMETFEDIRDVVDYLWDTYCKDSGRLLMAVGCSMGANILANLLGADGEGTKLTAAVCVQTPMKTHVIAEKIKEVADGLYDRGLCQNMQKVLLKNEEILSKYFKEEHDLDMLKTIDTMPLSVTEFDNNFTSKMFGYRDGPDYHYHGSCFHRLGKIRRPTLFMNALDDPIIGSWGIDWESFKENQHIVLATNEFGGHMGYDVGGLSAEQWFYKPALDFLYLFRYGPIEDQPGLASEM